MHRRHPELRPDDSVKVGGLWGFVQGGEAAEAAGTEHRHSAESSISKPRVGPRRGDAHSRAALFARCSELAPVWCGFCVFACHVTTISAGTLTGRMGAGRSRGWISVSGFMYTNRRLNRFHCPGYTTYPRTETTAYPPGLDLAELLKAQCSNSVWGHQVPTARDTINTTCARRARTCESAIDEVPNPPGWRNRHGSRGGSLDVRRLDGF